MKIKLNREFAQRHLFVTVLMIGLGGWFGYDGLIRYPSTDAAVLYREIEGNDAPTGFNLEAFKAQKTKTQYGFTILSLCVAAIVGSGLWKAYTFDFSFDENGFTWNGRTYAYSDIKSCDRSLWEKKGILKLKVADTQTNRTLDLTLDAWHNTGVKEFEQDHLREITPACNCPSASKCG